VAEPSGSPPGRANHNRKQSPIITPNLSLTSTPAVIGCWNMEIFFIFQHGSRRHVVFSKCGNFRDPKGQEGQNASVLFCSLAVLNPRVGHAMAVLSPFISILCHSDWFFHRVLSTSWCCLSRPFVVFLACVPLALFLALFLSPCNSLVSSWCDHSMLASSLWQCLTVQFSSVQFIV